jgi:hypothetical protein
MAEPDLAGSRLGSLSWLVSAGSLGAAMKRTRSDRWCGNIIKVMWARDT